MSSEIKADKWSPASGTSATIGDSGDTYTVPSGVTLNTSSATLTLPSSVITGQTAKTSLVDADKFLISDSAASGALKYVEKQYLPSGTFVEVAQSSIAAGSSVSAVEFSNIFSSSYNTYFVRLGKIRFAGLTSLQIQFYSDTGTTVESGSFYNLAAVGLDNAGNVESKTGNGADRFYLTNVIDYDQPADGGVSGHMYFNNPLANSNFSATAHGQVVYRNSANVWNMMSFGGKFSGSSPRYGIKVFGSENVEYADITVYGVKP